MVYKITTCIEFILFDMNFFYQTFPTLLIAMAIYYFKFAWVSGYVKKQQLTKLGLGLGIFFVSVVIYYNGNNISYFFSSGLFVEKIIRLAFPVGVAISFFIFLGAAFDATEKEEQNVDEK